MDSILTSLARTVVPVGDWEIPKRVMNEKLRPLNLAKLREGSFPNASTSAVAINEKKCRNCNASIAIGSA